MKLIFDCAYENWLRNGRRIRVLTIVDIWDRSSPAMEVDVALPG